MHAIQRYHHNRLQLFLQQMQQETETYKLPGHHLKAIVQQEKNLKQLYFSYLESLQQVASLIAQYELEYQSAKQLVNKHKQYLKQGLKKRRLKENI